MLAARVAAGELPPVEERIPIDPVVQEMLSDGVGRYGGTLRVSEAIGFMNQRGGELTTQMLDIYLLSMHQETLDIVPNIAAGYAVSDDGLTVTLELRPGTRWSNGDPFIVDDLMFVMEDMKWDDRVDPGWRASETPTFPDSSNLTIQIAARDRRPGGYQQAVRAGDRAVGGGRLARGAAAGGRRRLGRQPGRRRVHAAARRHRRHHRVLELDQRRRRLRRRRPARRLQHDRQLRRVGNRRAGWSSAASASCPTTAASCPASSRPMSGSATSTGSASSGSPSSAPASGSSWPRRCSTSPATTYS